MEQRYPYFSEEQDTPPSDPVPVAVMAMYRNKYPLILGLKPDGISIYPYLYLFSLTNTNTNTDISQMQKLTSTFVLNRYNTNQILEV